MMSSSLLDSITTGLHVDAVIGTVSGVGRLANATVFFRLVVSMRKYMEGRQLIPAMMTMMPMIVVRMNHLWVVDMNRMEDFDLVSMLYRINIQKLKKTMR